MTSERGPMRIGELAAVVGVSAHVLRAWERRYGLVEPLRSSGGYRLYGPEAEARVRAVLALRAQGVPVSSAVAQVLAERRLGAQAADSTGQTPRQLMVRLREAVDRFDERSVQVVLDDALDGLGLEPALCEVVLPYLGDLGERWARGETTIGHEHFASQLIRRRLSARTLTWGVGSGPIAVLACPADERHDIALLAFGLLLGQAGWRIRFLGQDTPASELLGAVRVIGPDLVVLAATRSEALQAHAETVRQMSVGHVVAVGGPGATPAVAADLGAARLPTDLRAAVGAANRLVNHAHRPAQTATATSTSTPQGVSR
ncbi:MAG: MerR family transcriptional regulator [Dermatophilaceae bacterium]